MGTIPFNWKMKRTWFSSKLPKENSWSWFWWPWNWLAWELLSWMIWTLDFGSWSYNKNNTEQWAASINLLFVIILWLPYHFMKWETSKSFQVPFMKETFVQTLWLGKIAWKQAKQISPRNATLQSDDGDDEDDDDFTPWTILWPFFSFHSLSMNGKKKNIRNSECPGWLVTHVRNDPFRSFFDLFAGMILSFLESDPLDPSVGMQNWITSARIFNSWIFMAGGEWINSPIPLWPCYRFPSATPRKIERKNVGGCEGSRVFCLSVFFFKFSWWISKLNELHSQGK